MKHLLTRLFFTPRAKRAAICVVACSLFFIASAHQTFAQWKQSSGYSSGSMYNFFGASFGGSNYLLISAQTTGIPVVTIDSLFASTDNGQTWNPFAANGGNEMAAVTMNGVPSLIGSASFLQKDNSITAILSYSTATALINPLQTWLPDTLGFPTAQPINDPLASSFVTIGSTIYAADGAYGIYQQTAPGSKWTADTVGMTRNDTPYSISAMIVFGSNIYASTYGGGMMVTSNQGASWSSINDGLTSPLPGVYLGPGGAVFAISGLSLFAMIPNNGYGFDTLYNFYRLGGDGKTWTLMNSTPQKRGVGVITNFAASSNLLFTANDSTVNFSNDNGATWQQADQGLPMFGGIFSGITSVSVSGSNLVIGILGGVNQIWYRPLSQFISSSVDPSSVPASGLSLTLSENPASGSTVTAIYTLPHAGVAQVSLMDDLGRSIRVLQNGPASAGQNSISLDPQSLAPGTYFVRVESDGSNVMAKLVITH